MKKYKPLIGGLITVLALTMFVAMLSGCVSKEAEYTTELKESIFEKYGFPAVDNYFEYTELKEIYELRDDPNLLCHWYTRNDMTGKWVYQGECIGYGIPYGASITAPEAYQHVATGNWDVVPMAEPNGLYTESVVTTATWILTTDEQGEILPVYVETAITVSQTKLDKRLCEDWSIPSDY